MSLSAIYKIQSVIKPERIYIGSAVNIPNRWKEHINGLRRNKHHSKKLQRHFDKYGQSDLQFSILLGCDKEDLIKTEQYFIDSYKPYFNSSPIAGRGCNLGIKMTEEQKRKISLGRKGKFKLSEEHKNKLIAANRNRKLSMEHREKIALSRRGKPSWNKGRLLSEEHREKIGEANKGKIITPETRKKISETRKKRYPAKEKKIGPGRVKYWIGKKFSIEHKKKIGEARKGRIHSMETKQKIGDSNKGCQKFLGKTHSEETKQKMRDAWAHKRLIKVVQLN